MNTIATQPTSTPILFGRHLAGILVVSLINPAIWRSSDMLTVWVSTWLFPIGLALALYGAYLLFFTARAKAAWPKSFFVLAWVLLALLILGNYQGSQQKAGSSPASVDRWWESDPPVPGQGLVR